MQFNPTGSNADGDNNQPIDDQGESAAQHQAPGEAVMAADGEAPVADLDMNEEGDDRQESAPGASNEAKMDTDLSASAPANPPDDDMVVHPNPTSTTGNPTTVDQPLPAADTGDQQMQDATTELPEAQPDQEIAEEDGKDEQMEEVDDEEEEEPIEDEETNQIQGKRVADLPWEDKQQALKNYWKGGWQRFYNVGEWVDAVDTVQKWCVASAIDIKENFVEVHFDGWGNRWDVTYRFTSGKVAPFRAQSQGYTGQAMTPLRQNMQFDIQELQDAKARIQAIIESEFKGISAHETTQYLRGTLFVYTDFLLSANTRPYTDEDLVEVDDYMHAVIRLVVAWLRKAKEIVKTAGPDFRRDPDIFLVDEDVAILAACPELMGLLDRMFCGCHRCLRYYLYYDKNVIKKPNMVSDPQHNDVDFQSRRQAADEEYDVELLREKVRSKDKDLVFGQAINFLNYFAEIAGFDAYFQLLQVGNSRPPENSDSDKKDGKGESAYLPLDFLADLTSPFLRCAPLMDKKFAWQFVTEVEEIVTTRLMEMRDKDIKELDRDTLAGLITSFRIFLRIAKPSAQIAELTEQIELSFASRFLKTTYLDKKLQGLQDLKRLIDGTAARGILERQRQRRIEAGQPPGRLLAYLTTASGAKIRPTEFLDSAKLRDWMVKEQVAEMLFADSSHAELLKRAAHIVRFLCQQNAITQEIIDMIWKCQQGKHEETVRVVFGLIIEIALDLPPNLLDSLFEKISAIPESQYSEMYLEFIKNFTIKAYEQTERLHRQAQRIKAREAQKANGQDDDEEPEEEEDTKEAMVFQNITNGLENPETVGLAEGEKLYGMPILWTLIQDEYVSKSDLSGSDQFDFVMEAVREVLSQSFSQKVRMYYLLKSLKNLIEGKSIYSSTMVFTCIMELVSAPSSDYSGITRQEALKLLEDQIGIVQVILQDITRYDEQVKEGLKQVVRQTGGAPESIDNHVFAGRMGHRATLAKLLDMLEFVVRASDWAVIIKAENLESLWKTFVLAPTFSQDQAQFLGFINKKRTRTQRMPPDATGYVARRTHEINLLTREVQQHFFTQILCNPTFIDYSKLTSGQAKCFQTYFRLINQEEGHLEQQGGRIQVRNFDKLVGKEGLWRITFETDNEKAREESGDLLVDLHLKLAPEYEPAVRRQIMQEFIEKSFKSMLELSETIKEQGAEAKLLGIIQVLSKFLNKYEGKKPIKPEMKALALQFSSIQMVTVSVLLAREGLPPQEARIQVSQFETMGAVRERCATTFGLDLNEFEMRLRRAYDRIVDPDEDDDRYVKDHGISSQIFLTKNTSYDKQGHPKHLIAGKQEYFELIFTLLAKGTQKVIEPVWALLQKLPVNKNLHADIKELRGAEESWDRLLDSSSAHRLLYCLKIIEGLTDASFEAKAEADEKQTPEQDPEKDQIGDSKTTEGETQQATDSAGSPPGTLEEWKRRFTKLGGFQHLITTFTGLEKGSLDPKLTLRCLGGLLTAINDFIAVDGSLHTSILEQREAVVSSCLRYVHLIGLQSLEVERERGESFEDLQAKQAQKRRAKWKLRQLQMAGSGNEKNRRGQQQAQEEEGSDDEDDSEQLRSVLGEFGASRRLLERIYEFMGRFIFQRDKTSLKLVGSFPQLSDLIRVGLVESENAPLRAETGRRLREILVSCASEPGLNDTLTGILRVMLIEVLPAVRGRERRCTQYFDQVGRTIRELSVADMQQLEAEIAKLMETQAAAIQAQPSSTDPQFKHQERAIDGLMSLLGVLLQKYPKRKVEIGSQLIPHLLQQCLLQVAMEPGKEGQNERRGQASRVPGLRLLPILMRDCLANLKVVLDHIAQFSRSASWRTNKASDWEIARADDEKSSTGYVGLKNLGCICYMISLFQQLFMIPSLREDILAVQDPNHDNQEPSENMLYQFQAIFAGLLKSEKQYVNPKGFCHAFKDWEGQPTNVLEQMDVEEFLQMFLDRLETAIKGTPQEKTIQYHFGGKFASEMICKGCPHQYERSEPFLSMGVPVKNKRTLQEGLSAFVQGDMLEGENAYLCAKCDKKVDTLKRYSVKELPRYLLISLKRFEFDFDRCIRVKVNDYCEFPTELDMLPYTQEGLSRKERAAKLKQAALEKGEEFNDVDEPLKHPKEYYEFKLKGMVVHTGTADSGHYYSFIREHKTVEQQGKEEKWYEFNDNIVRDFDLADLPNECFGGEEFFSGPGMQNMKTPKWRNAYLVIYERKSQVEVVHDDDESAQKEEVQKNDKLNSEDNLPKDEEIEEKKLKPTDSEHPIQQQIALDNLKYWHGKYLFANEYFQFVSEVTYYWDMANIIPMKNLNKNNDSHIVGLPMRVPPDFQQQIQQQKPTDEVFDLREQHSDNPQVVKDAAHQIFKFAASFYLTILQRAQAKGLVSKLINALKSYMNNDPRNGLWLLKEISNWEIIKEMLLQPMNPEMPKLTCGLIYCAMLTVYNQEKASLKQHWVELKQHQQQNTESQCPKTSLGVLGNLVLLLISNVYKLSDFSLTMPQYFRLLTRFASLGPEAREFLLQASTVGRCMALFFGIAGAAYKEKYQDISSIGPIRITEDPEIGLPTAWEQRTYFQALIERKRQQKLALSPPKYKYLLELVSLCIRHLNIGGQGHGPYWLDHGHATLTNFVDGGESDLCTPGAKHLKKVFAAAKRNRAMWAISQAHCHYTSNDPESIAELFKTAQTSLDQRDFDEMRPYLCLLEVMFETPHPNFVAKRKEWLEQFLEVVKNNQIYYRWMETAVEFIFKIVSRNPAVKDWFYANPQKWIFVSEWVKRSARPPHPAQATETNRLLKARPNESAMMVAIQRFNHDNQNPGRIALTAAYRRHRMSQMLNQTVPDLRNEVDPDRGDLQDYKFIPGDVVYLYDRKREDGDRWRVASVFDELISLGMDGDTQGRVRWQKCDTDKLVLEDVFDNMARNRIRRELYEQQQNQAAQGARGQARNNTGRMQNSQGGGSDDQDPDQAWQGDEDGGQGAPQDGTGSDSNAYGESDGETDIYG